MFLKSWELYFNISKNLSFPFWLISEVEEGIPMWVACNWVDVISEKSQDI